MIAIHYEPQIPWQSVVANNFLIGLKELGLNPTITKSRYRESDIAILLGTTLWRNIEADGRYLLVDRASFGDPDYLQLVWDGHGRRGNHCVPANRGTRAREIAPTVRPWQGGSKVVLCGQTETYSPHYDTLDEWYSSVEATHFRKHPRGTNPTNLPTIATWDDCGLAVVLNSSIAVDCVINGIPTVTMDEGSMAYDVTGHAPHIVHMKNRAPWLDWLSWTQWHKDEIREGEPIRHLFEDVL